MEQTPEPAGLTYLALADELIRANDELSKWNAYKDSITARLHAFHEAGTVPTSFTYAGHSISLSPGRSTKQYDPEAKAHRAALDKRLAADGHVTNVQGKPFWTVRSIKP
jgi:hypothetical protein